MQRSPNRESNLVIGRWRCVPEPDHRGRDQGVVELNIVRIVAVNPQQGHALQQVLLHGLPIVDVHEFTGDQPAGQSVVGHPGVRDAEEIAVETRKPADADACASAHQLLKPAFLVAGQMVMSDVGWIADYQSGPGVFGGGRGGFGKVGDMKVESSLLPQFGRPLATMRVDFVAPRHSNLGFRKEAKEGGVKRAGAEGGQGARIE